MTIIKVPVISPLLYGALELMPTPLALIALLYRNAYSEMMSAFENLQAEVKARLVFDEQHEGELFRPEYPRMGEWQRAFDEDSRAWTTYHEMHAEIVKTFQAVQE